MIPHYILHQFCILQNCWPPGVTTFKLPQDPGKYTIMPDPRAQNCAAGRVEATKNTKCAAMDHFSFSDKNWPGLDFFSNMVSSLSTLCVTLALRHTALHRASESVKSTCLPSAALRTFEILSIHYMLSTYLGSLKRSCGSIKVRVEQIWLEMFDQGPIPQRRRRRLRGLPH